jgi:hypothetical protein
MSATAAAAILKHDEEIDRILQPSWYKKVNGVSHAELTLTTYGTLERIIRADRGLEFSKAHWAALYALCMTLTSVAQGKKEERIVWGLPTGAGKTSTLQAFLIALAKLGLDHVGVVICQARIGALIELHRELQGTAAASRVTLLHSDKKASVPSDNLDPNEARQFVLMTHAAVIDRGRLHAFREWQGRQRVIAWDETLFSMEPVSIDISALGTQLGGLKLAARERPDLQEALDYLTTNEEAALDAIDKLKAEGVQSGTAPLVPCRDEEKLDRMRAALANIPRSTDAASTLLNLAQLPEARVRTAELRGGVISYREAIPRDLGSIVVLDASWPCRTLLKNDATLVSAEDLPAVKLVKEQWGLDSLTELKSYHDVEVTQILAAGGRSSVVGTRNATRKGDLQKPKPVLLQVVVDEVLKADDEGAAGVLVYHFKSRDGDPDALGILKAALEERRPGITTKLTDPERVEKTASGRQPVWLKHEVHGSETGYNHGRHCELVIMWGVLHDADHVITSKLAATCDDLGTDMSYGRVQGFRNSEKHHRVLQAISRGRMRSPGNEPGAAAPMRALVVDPDETLGTAMAHSLPGIVWNYRPGPKGYSVKRGIPFIGGKALARFLKRQTGDWLSARAAKAAVVAELGEPLPSKTWKRLRDKGLPEAGWKVVGAKLVRKGSNL